MKKYLLDGVIIVGLIFSSFYDPRLVHVVREDAPLSVGKPPERNAGNSTRVSGKRKPDTVNDAQNYPRHHWMFCPPTNSVY